MVTQLTHNVTGHTICLGDVGRWSQEGRAGVHVWRPRGLAAWLQGGAADEDRQVGAKRGAAVPAGGEPRTGESGARNAHSLAGQLTFRGEEIKHLLGTYHKFI